MEGKKKRSWTINRITRVPQVVQERLFPGLKLKWLWQWVCKVRIFSIRKHLNLPLGNSTFQKRSWKAGEIKGSYMDLKLHNIGLCFLLDLQMWAKKRWLLEMFTNLKIFKINITGGMNQGVKMEVSCWNDHTKPLDIFFFQSVWKWSSTLIAQALDHGALPLSQCPHEMKLSTRSHKLLFFWKGKLWALVNKSFPYRHGVCWFQQMGISTPHWSKCG